MTLKRDPGLVVVPAGAFADVTLPAPWVEIHTDRRHPWTRMPALDGIGSMA